MYCDNFLINERYDDINDCDNHNKQFPGRFKRNELEFIKEFAINFQKKTLNFTLITSALIE